MHVLSLAKAIVAMPLAGLPILGYVRLAELTLTGPVPAGVQTAVIVNTGSTNTNGYHVNLPLLGEKQYGRLSYWVTAGASPAGQPSSGTLPASLAKKFAHDLSAAMPLNTLPIAVMMKSASFGTSTYVTYRGQQTPDLSAPADARGQALKADIMAIVAALNLKNGPRRPTLPQGTPVWRNH